MRSLVLLMVLLLGIVPVLAGELTGSIESVGASGSTFVAQWAQGCPAESIEPTPGYTLTTDPTGPNACVTYQGVELSPLYCPIDSDGTTGEFVDNCDDCGCRNGAFCHSSGECRSCAVVPCSTCDPGEICTERYESPGSCNIVGSCYYPPIDFAYHIWMTKCALVCFPAGDRRGTWTLYGEGSWKDIPLTHTVGGVPSCYQRVRVTHEGDSLSWQRMESWGACNFGFELEQNSAVVRTQCCSSVGLGCNYFEDFVSVPRGSSRTTTRSCNVPFEYGEVDIGVTRSSTGSVSCSIVDTRGSPSWRIMECQ